jgi:hypothetical protein
MYQWFKAEGKSARQYIGMTLKRKTHYILAGRYFGLRFPVALNIILR